MSATPRIVGHAVVAAGFFFSLQRFVNGADVQTSVVWAIIAAIAAAALAYSQSRRGR
jgi:hypothetical protein